MVLPDSADCLVLNRQMFWGDECAVWWEFGGIQHLPVRHTATAERSQSQALGPHHAV